MATKLQAGKPERKPNTHNKTKIINALEALNLLPQVSVTTNDKKDKIEINHSTVHSLGFIFKWQTNHFVGYTIDAAINTNSQAIVAIQKPAEALHFTAAYTLLTEIRAKRRISK